MYYPLVGLLRDFKSFTPGTNALRLGFMDEAKLNLSMQEQPIPSEGRHRCVLQFEFLLEAKLCYRDVVYSNLKYL
jgi:hypothetical protein